MVGNLGKGVIRFDRYTQSTKRIALVKGNKGDTFCIV